MSPGHHHHMRSSAVKYGYTKISQSEIVSVISIARGTARVVRAAILEVRVHAGLLRGESVSRVVLEEGLQQIASSLLEIGNQGGVETLPLGKGGLVVGERGDTRPCIFVGGTEDTMDQNVSA